MFNIRFFLFGGGKIKKPVRFTRTLHPGAYKNRLFTHNKKMKHKVKKFFSAAAKVLIAALIGCVNGFFGGGGGMLCVPFLEKAVKLPTKKAHATAIAVIAPITLFSACVYLFKGAAPFPQLWYVTGGVLVGGIAGALLLKKLPSWLVGGIFSLMMIAAGIKLIIGG